MKTKEEEEFDRQEAEYNRQLEEKTLSKNSLELFNLLDSYVNGGGGSHSHEARKLAKAIAYGHANGALHRTLQQAIVKLFIMTIEEIASLPENATDARNEDSRLIAIQMIEGFKKVRSEYDSQLHSRPINDAVNPSQYIPFI